MTDAPALTSTTPPSPCQLLTHRLEAIIASVLEDLAHERPLQLPIRTRLSTRPQGFRRNAFPGRRAEDARAFAILITILNHIHRCLVDGVRMTKRDLYYQEPALFGSQAVVDRIIDDVALTLGVGRAALNVTAAPRGLSYGSFTITREDGRMTEGTSDPQGILVPNADSNEHIDISNVFWILVIEKEVPAFPPAPQYLTHKATFRSLVESGITTHRHRPGMLVTAKGYPDLATRAFLFRLAAQDPCLPIHVLADYDPDGFAIAAIYAVGSRALAHEAVRLVLPRLSWIGVRSGDIIPRDEPRRNGSIESVAEATQDGEKPNRIEQRNSNGIASDSVETEPAAESTQDGLLRLTDRDRKRARAMLARSMQLNAAGGAIWADWPAWRREVRVMLMLNVKAEMQVLDQRDSGMRSWIEGKLGL